MPFEVYLLWNQYPWVLGEATCDAKMLATEMVTYSSIFTIVAFTIERWVCLYVRLCMDRVSSAGFSNGGRGRRQREGGNNLSDVPSCLPQELGKGRRWINLVHNSPAVAVVTIGALVGLGF